MKQTFFFLATMLFSGYIFGQPLQNHIYLSGTLGFSSTSASTTQGNVTTDEFTLTTINISPAIGYTLSDNILAGVRTNFTRSIRKEPDDGPESRTSNFGVGVFGRYYIPIEDRFLFYPELLVGFGSGRSEFTDNGITVTNPDVNSFLVGVIAGFAYYPSTHWGVELSTGAIGFASSTNVNETTDPDTESRRSTFGFGVDGIMVNVGVSYLLQLGDN